MLSLIFGIGIFFCIKERTIDLILSWKVDILAGNILPFVEEFKEKKFPACQNSLRGWNDLLYFFLWEKHLLVSKIDQTENNSKFKWIMRNNV